MKVQKLAVNYLGNPSHTGGYIEVSQSIDQFTSQCADGWYRLTEAGVGSPSLVFVQGNQSNEFVTESEARLHMASLTKAKRQNRKQKLESALDWAKSQYPVGGAVPGILQLSNNWGDSAGEYQDGVYFSVYLDGRCGRGAAKIMIKSEEGRVVAHEINDWLGLTDPDRQ